MEDTFNVRTLLGLRWFEPGAEHGGAVSDGLDWEAAWPRPQQPHGAGS